MGKQSFQSSRNIREPIFDSSPNRRQNQNHAFVKTDVVGDSEIFAMDMHSCGNFRFHLRNTKVGKGALAHSPHSPFVRPIISPRDNIFGSKKGFFHVRIASVSSKNEREPPQHFRSGTGRCCHYVEFVPWIINCGLINRDIKKVSYC